MKIKEISYLVPPRDLINDRLDGILSLEDENSTDGFSYVVEVRTPKCLSTIMEESKSEFLPPGYPYIIVQKLTKEIIHAAIQSFFVSLNDSY